MSDADSNINYDLVTLLQNKMKNFSRLEKFYCKDAEVAKCHSRDALEQIKQDEARHIDMLKEEIKMRISANVF